MFNLFSKHKSKKNDNSREQLASDLIGIEKSKMIRALQEECSEFLRFADRVRLFQDYYQEGDKESAEFTLSELKHNAVYAALAGAREYEGALKNEVRRLSNWFFVNDFGDYSEKAFLNAAEAAKLYELAREADEIALTSRSKYDAAFEKAAYKRAKEKNPTLV